MIVVRVVHAVCHLFRLTWLCDRHDDHFDSAFFRDLPYAAPPSAAVRDNQGQAASLSSCHTPAGSVAPNPRHQSHTGGIQ